MTMLTHISVEQGTEMIFSHYDTGGQMWTGTGPREERKRVTFDLPFATVPNVHVSASLWDVETSSNIRLDIFADEVSEQGFDIVVRTWDDTRIARLRADWLAIGGAVDPDLWRLG